MSTLSNNNEVPILHFAVDGILPLEAILPSPFTCVDIAIITTTLAVMLWCVNSATALKCNGYGLEFLLAERLGKCSVH